MKKVISLICVFCILLVSIPVLGADEGETIGLDFVTYKIKNGKALVDWVNRDLKGTVTIPESVNGYPVTEIGQYAFTDCKYITEVVLPKSIAEIYAPAFRNCVRLEKINIPCISVNSPVFQNCQHLKEVVLEEKLKYLHHGVFSDCVIEKLVIKNKDITIRRRGNLTAPEPQTGTFIDTKIGTIYAYKGSDGEKYAEEMGIKFALFDDDVTVKINNEYLDCDTAPYIKNDRTMVPLRAIFEALGAEVSWDNTARAAIGVMGDLEIKITIGENILYKNGEEIPLDAPAEITNDRTMVPVRAISEAFGATVSWDNENKNVNITKIEEITLISIGTHAISEDDPYYVDPITGDKYMSAEEAQAKIQALEKVKELLGVEIQFVQYASDYATLLPESVEKGEPFCHLATLWGGSQKQGLDTGAFLPIDDYIDIFSGEIFPLEPKTKGHYYFMSRGFNYINTWPITYNMDMLDEIPELKKEDGTTLYPAELYYRGEWTWEGFENYMSIISEYCEKQKSSGYSYIVPVPFETNYAVFAEQALHSVGESIFDGENIKAGSEAALKAVEFTASLFKKGLVSCKTAEKSPTNSGWLTSADDFVNRKTFFTNCPPWRLDEAGASFSLGIVPFPYPDGTNPVKEKSLYSHSNRGGDSIALVKGFDDKTNRLAILAYKTYLEEYYKALAGVNSMDEFIESYASSDAKEKGIDVENPRVGELHVRIWQEYGKTPVNERSEAFGQLWKWSSIFGECVFTDKGFAEYKGALEALE